MREVRATRIFVALAASAALVAGGCGDDSSEPGDRDQQRTTADAPRISSARDILITRREIERAGRDTPAAALLGWWQAMQFQEGRRAKELFSQDVELTAAQLTERARRLAPYFSRAKLQVLEESRDASTATLRVAILGATVRGDDISVVEVPGSFEMVEEDGQWRLADDRFLVDRIDAQRAAERAAREQAADRP